MKKIILRAFSLIELMLTLIIVSCITAALAPVITKKLKSKEITISSGGNKNIEFEQDCTAFGDDCAICFDDRCALCAKVCNNDEYVDTPPCKCAPCADRDAQCIECSAKQCKRCNLGYYVVNGRCRTCPIANQCDGVYKTACTDGYYSDVEGSVACKSCSSNIENCLTCNKETGACETCKDGYELKEDICKSKDFKYEYTGASAKTVLEEYTRVVLTSSGNFTAYSNATAEVMVLGGGSGGGGGCWYGSWCGGANGCAGKSVTETIILTEGETHAVTIGGGGGGGRAASNDSHCGSKSATGGSAGGTSKFGTISASGGSSGNCGSAITFAGLTYASGIAQGANTGTGGIGGTGDGHTVQAGGWVCVVGGGGGSGYSGVVVIKVPR